MFGSSPSFGSDGIERVLLGIYEQFRVAASSGDVDKYRMLRDPIEIKKMEERVGIIAEEHISYTAGLFTSAKDLQSVKAVEKGVWAKLSASAGDAEPDAGGERTKFLIVLFRKVNFDWKVVRVGNISDRKFRKDGQPTTVEDISVSEKLKIPNDGT